jgi:cellulose synthase/poly-beta-1,6-N-acetylglucosamine synthase-like glycosyltransferase
MDIERRNAHRNQYTRLANGPNSAFRKDVLLAVGGFNPAWYHAEDTEVSYRIWNKGLRIQYVPDAIVNHVAEEDWRQYLRKRYRDAKAFTRMLVRYTKPAVLQDDYVSLGMKVQPPLYLLLVILGILALLLSLTPYLGLALVLLAGFSILAVLLVLPEAIAVAYASRRTGFFFKTMAIGLMRGFAWGAGLGVGSLRQLLHQ